MSTLKRKEWDSDFFGYEIYCIDCTKLTEFEFKDQVYRIKSLGAKLIYIYADEEIDYVKYFGGVLADKKITFQRKVIGFEQTDESIITFKREDDHKKLLNLAFESGIYSRFKLDHNFKNKEFEKLYTEWIGRSVSREIADEVFVYNKFDTILGVVTLSIKDSIASIGLISVLNLHRGEKIGSKLLNASVEYASKQKCDFILVPTQAANINACNFYLKNNFSVHKIEYIYHIWL